MDSGESRLITVPNILTMVRFLLIPVFLITYYQLPEQRYISMLVFAIASITDGVDGYLARKLNQITSFGKLFDPLADKLMILSMLFCLSESEMLLPTQLKWLNAAVLWLILAKELFMLCGGLYMLKHGHVVHSNYVGKSATAVFCVAILAVFPWHNWQWLRSLGQWLVVLATCLTFTALITYIVSSVKLLKKG